MLNYNKLFDIIYSETLPESVKCDVLDKINSRIDESELLTLNESELNPMTSFISSLIESNITEEGLYEIIDLTFESISEEVINEVSDELRKQAAQSSLASRRAKAGWAEAKEKELGPRISKDKGSVGLADMRKKWATQDRIKADARLQHAENVASRDTAKNKLKDTVGKIFKHKDTPVGLSRIKGLKHSNDASSKPQENKPEIKEPENKPQTATTKDSNIDLNQNPYEEKLKKMKARVDKDNKPGEGVLVTPAPQGGSKQLSLDFSSNANANGTQVDKTTTNNNNNTTSASKNNADNNTTSASKNNADSNNADSNNADNNTNKNKNNSNKRSRAPKNTHEPGTEAYLEHIITYSTSAKKVEDAKKKLETLRANKNNNSNADNVVKNANELKNKSGDSNTGANADSVAKNANELKKKNKGVKAKKKKTDANESLTNAICSLIRYNVSEESFSEIMEMISNKKAAEKAVDREHETFNKKMDTLSKAEETKAKTGIDPLSTEQRENITKEAEKAGSRYETFRRLANNKYNLNK